MSVFNAVLPVATLVVGAFLQQFIGGVTQTRADRRAARDLLAEHPRQLWTRGEEEGWIELQVYAARLVSALQTARVDPEVANRLRHALEAFWRKTEHSGDPQIGQYQPNKAAADELDESLAIVARQLDESWRRRPSEGRGQCRTDRCLTNASRLRRLRPTATKGATRVRTRALVGGSS